MENEVKCCVEQPISYRKELIIQKLSILASSNILAKEWKVVLDEAIMLLVEQ